MRTTVVLDGDVAAAVDRRRRELSEGLSQAVNALIRAGLAVRPSRPPFRQETHAMALRLDVTNVDEVLDLLETDTP